MILEVKSLTKSFSGGVFAPRKKVLDAVEFFVPKGKATGFVGINGSGKTTTLKCILGFVNPEEFAIDFFGKGPLSPATKSLLGFLPERPYYYEFLTASQFLRFHWELSGGGEDFEKRSREVLQSVQLQEYKNQKLKTFSKGMLQRIGIAQAILRNPEFLILDEPMSGLDPDGRIMVKDIMRAELKKGTSLFFSSHLLSDVEEICEHLVIIHQGKILFCDSLARFITTANAGNEQDERNSEYKKMGLEEAFGRFLKG